MPTACYAVRNPAFQPAMRIVTAISQSNPAIVTTSFAHQYVSGTIVRLDIPLANGMPQISGVPYPGITYPITVVSPTQFSVPIDSTNFQPYVDVECCCVVPLAELNSQFTAATQNVLPLQAT